MTRTLQVLVLGVTVLTTGVSAQEPFANVSSKGAPRFLLAGSPEPVPLDISRTPVLRRQLTLDLEGATVRDALAAISRQAGLQLTYMDEVVPKDVRVDLQANAITVAAALTDVLLDAGLDVVFSASNRAVIVNRPPGAVLPGAVGVIEGMVVGARSEGEPPAPIASAQVVVEGTGLGTLTNNEGRFQIAGVPVGRHSVAVSSIGWRRVSQEVDVAEGETVTVDFTLEVSPTTLNELVVTATGQQRRVELGHVVGRIDADAIVKEAPVSTISELLTGRVAGVQVFQNQGTVGGQVRLKVRGPNSLALSNEPIVVVDGIRYTISEIPRLGLGGPEGSVAAAERTSPLNDLNPNDIESVEVVKGPSAATLYGTDAANGVILITTKRGHGGPVRWSAYGKTSRTSIPAFRYPDVHRGYGSTPTGLEGPFCFLWRVADGICTQQDSIVVVPNPLNDSELTIFGSQPTWETGLSVSGGNDDVGYYFSGSYLTATGPVQMPQAAVELLEANRGERIPEEWGKPNTRTNLNLRANMTARLGAADLAVQASYIRDATQSFPISNPFSNARGVFSGTPTNPYGEARPEEVFASQSTERTDRFVGSATAHWRPMPWLLARAAVGLDVGSRNRYSLVRRGDAPTSLGAFGLSTGAVADERARQLTNTGDLLVSATARSGRLSFRTSVGGQYVRSLMDAVASPKISVFGL